MERVTCAGLEDIGHFFPDTDPKYKNISSLLLLKKVISALKKKKFRINNIDITIVAEKPALHPYIKEIKSNLSKILILPVARIGLKATTNETMGFIGRGEGIAAIAIASII